MDKKSRTEASKFLSYVLRHQPEAVGIALDANGWVDVDELLAACASHGRALSRDELAEVVTTNSKQRFALSDDGARIRASQGHSTSVDLAYEPVTPPDVLYHGTAAANLPAIERDGLQRMSRHHVHLSLDVETAKAVGGRHGKPVVLEVDARAMHSAGHAFFVTPNNVWLTETVPTEFIRSLSHCVPKL